jgi:two-component system, LytTR family, sensor kinase
MKHKPTTGKGRRRVILHVMAWMIIFIFPLYWLTQQNDRLNEHFGRFYVQSVAYLCIFYLSFFWLVPKFWMAGKRWLFIIVTTLTMGAIYFSINLADDRFFPPPKEFLEREILMARENPERISPDRMRKRFFLGNFLFSSILISGFCIGLRGSEKLAENEEQRKELEKEVLNSELAFLKNQISPHFFFNTLNNIYSLIAINQDDAQESVLKLSKLMRYLLYESEQGSTTLGREISFMRNYIDLMKLRVSDKVTLEANFPDDHPDLPVPPLIFIPFIENAFKHGITYHHPSFIRVSLKIEGKMLVFRCENSIGSGPGEGPEPDSGIGLDNVTKRLHLLYPDRHTLKITRHDTTYEVFLEMDMDIVRS